MAASDYVVGESHPARKGCATFETKGGDGTGAGYERWRSVEWRPHTARRGAEDVYVPVHRLLAVVACYPADQPLGDVFDDLAGKDVHHRNGIKWHNTPENIEVREHGRHSEITQQLRRAWAADAKHAARADDASAEGCALCGPTPDTFARVDGVDGTLCLDCAMDRSDGGAIEVV